eukprot:365283-Chlamydomonas_euryale.AAC.5
MPWQPASHRKLPSAASIKPWVGRIPHGYSLVAEGHFLKQATSAPPAATVAVGHAPPGSARNPGGPAAHQPIGPASKSRQTPPPPHNADAAPAPPARNASSVPPAGVPLPRVGLRARRSCLRSSSETWRHTARRWRSGSSCTNS